MRFLNAEISKGIATATLQVEEGREQSERGETRVHDDNARDVAQYVSSKVLQDRINDKVIRPIVFFEFGEEGLPLAPTLRYDWRDRASWGEVSDAMEQGVPLSVRLLRQDYNLPIPEDESGEDAFVSPAVQPAGPTGASPSGASPSGGAFADPSKKKASAGQELKSAVLPTARPLNGSDD